MRTFLKRVAGLGVLGLAGFFLLSTPFQNTPEALPTHEANVANGETLYNAAGCHSCHVPTKESGLDEALPAGGTALATPVGALYPPNITPDVETGIGAWPEHAFVRAMKQGKGRDGYPLIPAFPYTSYAQMSDGDVRDLFAYLKTLPPVKNTVPQHEVLGLNIVRRGMTFWQWIGLETAAFSADTTQTPSWNRGAYLVNGPGHCQECHTPRTLFMTRDESLRFAGGAHPEGVGTVPSLIDLVGRGRYKDANDVALALQFGGAMGYEKLAAGGMAKVQRNIAKLPEADIKAIAEYLVSLTAAK